MFSQFRKRPFQILNQHASTSCCCTSGGILCFGAAVLGLPPDAEGWRGFCRLLKNSLALRLTCMRDFCIDCGKGTLWPRGVAVPPETVASDLLIVPMRLRIDPSLLSYRLPVKVLPVVGRLPKNSGCESFCVMPTPDWQLVSFWDPKLTRVSTALSALFLVKLEADWSTSPLDATTWPAC